MGEPLGPFSHDKRDIDDATVLLGNVVDNYLPHGTDDDDGFVDRAVDELIEDVSLNRLTGDTNHRFVLGVCLGIEACPLLGGWNDDIYIINEHNPQIQCFDLSVVLSEVRSCVSCLAYRKDYDR